MPKRFSNVDKTGVSYWRVDGLCHGAKRVYYTSGDSLGRSLALMEAHRLERTYTANSDDHPNLDVSGSGVSETPDQLQRVIDTAHWVATSQVR